MTQHGSDTRASRANRTEAAPRIVPNRTITHQPPFLLALILMPINLGLKMSMTLFRTVFYILSFIPRSLRPRAVTSGIARSTYGRRQLLPRDTAARFKREFEEQYGSDSLPFFEGGYANAYDAAKKDLKFLLVVLLSPEHDDTESFVRDTLLAPEVVELIRNSANRIILWGGNMRDSEAYQVCNDFNCTKFPWSALICLTPKEGSTRMGTVKRLAGPMSASAYAADLQAAISKYGPDLDAVRAERRAQEAVRNLRDEQDSAYERSLAADRERARQRKEAAAAAAEAEKRAQEQAAAAAEREEKRQRWRRWRAASIPPAPAAGDKDVVRIALKLPAAMGGASVRRPFPSSTTVEELYAFVECHDLVSGEAAGAVDEKASEPESYEHVYDFRIVAMMPRQVHEPSRTATLLEKIGRSGNLIVEEVAEELGSDSDSED